MISNGGKCLTAYGWVELSEIPEMRNFSEKVEGVGALLCAPTCHHIDIENYSLHCGIQFFFPLFLMGEITTEVLMIASQT